MSHVCFYSLTMSKKGNVLNAAVTGSGYYTPTKHQDAYTTWYNMIYRCYGGHHRTKSYVNCTVCEEWLDFQNFAKYYYDCQYRVDGWQLDKDIVCKNNTIYSPETCVFVPPVINKLFVRRKAYRGDLPIGVYYECERKIKKYKASMHDLSGKTKFLGRFSTPEEAFSAYKKAKEKLIHFVAEEFKDTVDPRLYRAMINYSVNKDD